MRVMGNEMQKRGWRAKNNDDEWYLVMERGKYGVNDRESLSDLVAEYYGGDEYLDLQVSCVLLRRQGYANK